MALIVNTPEGTPPATDVSQYYPDPDTTLDVILVIENAKLPSENRTWSIMWRLDEGKPQCRILQVVHEGWHSGWINWGPRTTAYYHTVKKSFVAEVGQYSLEQRRRWENIANSIDVCQDRNGSLAFVEDLLRGAAYIGLLPQERLKSLFEVLNRDG